MFTYKDTKAMLMKALHKYSVTVQQYKKNSPAWRTETTWERYWKQMNLLEDVIDTLLAVCVEYKFNVDEKTIARYEHAQETRHLVTINANI